MPSAHLGGGAGAVPGQCPSPVELQAGVLAPLSWHRGHAVNLGSPVDLILHLFVTFESDKHYRVLR